VAQVFGFRLSVNANGAEVHADNDQADTVPLQELSVDLADQLETDAAGPGPGSGSRKVRLCTEDRLMQLPDGHEMFMCWPLWHC